MSLRARTIRRVPCDHYAYEARIVVFFVIGCWTCHSGKMSRRTRQFNRRGPRNDTSLRRRHGQRTRFQLVSSPRPDDGRVHVNGGYRPPPFDPNMFTLFRSKTHAMPSQRIRPQSLFYCTVDTFQRIHRYNRLLLTSNVQWGMRILR